MEFKIIININILLCLKYNDESPTYNTIKYSYLLYNSTHNSESSSDIMLQYTLAKGSLVVLPPGLLHAGPLRPVLPGQAMAAPLLRLVEALINDVSKGSSKIIFTYILL